MKCPMCGYEHIEPPRQSCACSNGYVALECPTHGIGTVVTHSDGTRVAVIELGTFGVDPEFVKRSNSWTPPDPLPTGVPHS